MLKYNNKELDINSKSEELIKLYIEPSLRLKYKHPDLNVIDRDKSRAVILGAVMGLVDSTTISTSDIEDMGQAKIRNLAEILGNALTMALLEKNTIDVKFTPELATELFAKKLYMMMGYTSLINLATSAYKPHDIDIRNSKYYNIVLEEYNEFKTI